jgi:AraC family transcriptional regulator
VPAGHAASWEEGGPASMLGICLMPSIVRIAAEGMGLNPDSVSVAAQLQHSDPRVSQIGWALHAELLDPQPCGRQYAEGLGLALATRLIRRVEPLDLPRLGDIPKRRLSAVIDFIHDNLAHDLSLNELAAVAGLSPSHFSARFKAATGQPAHQFVVRCRVKFAMSLLANRNLNLTEVAAQSGFCDQSHMARCMRRVMGYTPSILRRQRE